MNTKKLRIALAAASLAAVLGLAHAQDPAGGKQTVPSQVVRLSDLDLSNPGDLRQLLCALRCLRDPLL
jgi:UrcA family protein